MPLKGVSTNSPIMSGTTGSMGGGLLAVGACATGTANVPGAKVGMTASCSPSTQHPGDGFTFDAWVSAPDVVTVKLTAGILGTPASTTYNVKVIP